LWGKPVTGYVFPIFLKPSRATICTSSEERKRVACHGFPRIRYLCRTKIGSGPLDRRRRAEPRPRSSPAIPGRLGRQFAAGRFHLPPDAELPPDAGGDFHRLGREGKCGVGGDKGGAVRAGSATVQLGLPTFPALHRAAFVSIYRMMNSWPNSRSARKRRYPKSRTSSTLPRISPPSIFQM